VKTNWEDIVYAVVNCRVCELAIALQLLVVTIYKWSINPITNSKPVECYFNTWQYVCVRACVRYYYNSMSHHIITVNFKYRNNMGSGLTSGWSPIQGALPSVYIIQSTRFSEKNRQEGIIIKAKDEVNKSTNTMMNYSIMPVPSDAAQKMYNIQFNLLISEYVSTVFRSSSGEYNRLPNALLNCKLSYFLYGPMFTRRFAIRKSIW
jgi:hypothetical protein